MLNKARRYGMWLLLHAVVPLLIVGILTTAKIFVNYHWAFGL